MLKVAHVISSLKKGGAEELVCSLVERLAPSMFTSEVIYFHGGPHVERLRSIGIPIHHIRGFICMYDPVFWWRFIKTLMSIKPDCIHAVLWSAHIASRLAGRLLRIPTIIAYHNQTTLLDNFRATIDKITLHTNNPVIAVSTTVAKSLTQSYPWLPANQITIIPNGIDPELLNKHQSIGKSSLGISESSYVIGSVGRLHPIKNHKLLLEAYAVVYNNLSKSYLCIVGDGTEEATLRAMVRNKGIDDRVFFIKNQQAYGYYPIFDCFVLPSAQEGMSMALLEAQLFGCPSIATHETATHDVIQDGINGLLVPPNNPAALATAILKILKNRSIRTNLGTMAHKNALNHFNVVQMVKKYENIFKKTVKIGCL